MMNTVDISCGLYYKLFTIVIYNRNAIGQYYKTMIIDYDRSWGSLARIVNYDRNLRS